MLTQRYSTVVPDCPPPHPLSSRATGRVKGARLLVLTRLKVQVSYSTYINDRNVFFFFNVYIYYFRTWAIYSSVEYIIQIAVHAFAADKELNDMFEKINESEKLF